MNIIKKHCIAFIVLIILICPVFAQSGFQDTGQEGQLDMSTPSSDTTGFQNQISTDLGVDINVGDGVGMNYNKATGVLNYGNGKSIALKDFRGKTVTIKGDTVTIGKQELEGSKNTKKNGNTLYSSYVKEATTYGKDPYYFDKVDTLNHEGFIVNNGVNVDYENGIFTIDSADSIIIDGGVATVVSDFSGTKKNFRVDSADNVQIRCLVLDDVVNTDFIVLQDSTRAEPDKDTTLFITDCSQTQSSFTANSDSSRVSITEAEPVSYLVEGGRVIYESATHRDILETETLSTITFDYYDGFQCTTMSPKATYFYADKLDARRDLAVRNPSYGRIYELCLRRGTQKTFSDADGVIDFVDKKMRLNDGINVLKYPLLDGEINALKLKLFFAGYSGQIMNAILDQSFTHFKTMTVDTKKVGGTLASQTTPNNYYEIIEKQAGKNIHTFIKISPKSVTVEDSLVKKYEDINIAEDNILTKNRLTILPKDHEKIRKILNRRKKLN